MGYNMFQSVGEWFATFPSQMRLFRWGIDILDIALLAFTFYWIYRFVKERRGGRLLIGIVAMFGIYLLSGILRMYAVSYLLHSLFQIGLIAILILFQPEVRSALERLSEEPLRLSRRLRKSPEEGKVPSMIKEICDAASDLARSRTGALIVIERSTKLGDVILSGVRLDAEISTYLLQNIFFKEAPLHDGAVIIREERICAAGCFLPLTEQTDVDPNLGTRHRAALGASETSDAIVIVVSEETGGVSMAYNRKLITDYTYQSLQRQLTALLVEPGRKSGKKEGGRKA